MSVLNSISIGLCFAPLGLCFVECTCIYQEQFCLSFSGPKLLSELDFNTRDEIAWLLKKTKYGLGGFKKVAAEYGMKPFHIGVVEDSSNPGNEVLDYIMTSKPDLTVYSFCKTLKGDRFKRCDIVQKLEDHFLVQEETANTAISSLFNISSYFFE